MFRYVRLFLKDELVVTDEYNLCEAGELYIDNTDREGNSTQTTENREKRKKNTNLEGTIDHFITFHVVWCIGSIGFHSGAVYRTFMN